MKFDFLLDTLKFTLRFFSKPRFTGSIMPSSRFLGKTMVRLANLDKNSIVVELGAGTGPITKQILESGFPASNLYCVEFDEQMCKILKRKFPEVNILNESAENLTKLFEDKNKPICAVISSLPLISLPENIVEKILSESESVLDKNGRFVQFTYNLNRDPNVMRFKNMQHKLNEKVFINLPPARVDAFEKF